MGLDNYWEAPKGTSLEELTFDPPLRLCGGLFSGHGDGSFRGKVYSGIVEAITGVSLYEDKIDNTTVCQMADALEKQDWDELSEDIQLELYDPDEDNAADARRDYVDLQRMFRGYAAAGYELNSWF